MYVLRHQGATVSSLFKIGVSQNGNYVIVLDFFKLAISCKQDSWLHSCLDNHMAIYFSIMNPLGCS